MTETATASIADLTARFAAKVVRTPSCHFWVGAIADDGYGRFAVGGGRVVRAHRWAWEQVYGPVPDGLMVMHGCDETSCVNVVECLLLGDQAANLEQMARRGRSAGRAHWGCADRRRAARAGPARSARRCAAGTTQCGWRLRSQPVTRGRGNACCSSHSGGGPGVRGYGAAGWGGC